MSSDYVTGRTSKFGVGATDDFSKFRAKDGASGNECATNAELWDAVTDALVAVERKLCNCEAEYAIGDAVAIAVDPLSYNVAVVDSLHCLVHIFDSLGQRVASLSTGTGSNPSDVAFHPDSGTMYVACPGTKCVRIYDSSPAFVASWSGQGTFVPQSLAADSYGHLFVVNQAFGTGILERYNLSSGAFQATVTTGVQKVRPSYDYTNVGACRLSDGQIWVTQTNGTLGPVVANAGQPIADFGWDSNGTLYDLMAPSKSIFFWGQTSGTIDSRGTAWELISPVGMCCGWDGYIYIADNGIVKQITWDGHFQDIFSEENFQHAAATGTKLMRRLTCPISSTSTPFYQGTQAGQRWKKVTTNVANGGLNSVTTSSTTNTFSADVYVDFLVTPGQFVWPEDIRISLRGWAARAYFKGIPASGFTASVSGKTRLRYIFSIVPCGTTYTLAKGATYTVDAFAYVSTL